MFTGINIDFSFMTLIVTIINVALLVGGIYLLYLVVKALRIYIKKNK